MKTYARLVDGFMVERIDPLLDADGAEIPIAKRFHPDFVAQLVEIDPEDPPPLPPIETPAVIEVTKRQAEQALILAGLDEQLEALLDAMPGIEGKLARAEWRSSNTVRRDRPLLNSMAVAMGLSEAQVDALFAQAAAL